MAYTPFDSTKPNTAQTGPAAVGSMNSNDVALWYGWVSGNAVGWTFAPVAGSGTPEQPQFQSGSVPVLRDISATLHQIDSRLARLETVAQKLQSSQHSILGYQSW